MFMQPNFRFPTLRLTIVLTLALSLGLLITACDSNLTGPDSSSDEGTSVAAKRSSRSNLEITEVHQNDRFGFELSEDEIPSGWTTIELVNRTQATHFALLRKASPEFLTGLREDGGEISADALVDAAVHPFQEVWNPYYRGQIRIEKFAANLAQDFPGWFFKHRANGGPGLTSGGKTSRTTQNLKPGTYFIECYVIGEDGAFHLNGMVEKLVVTGKSSGGSEPRPTMRVSIDDEGIEVKHTPGTPGVRPGRHTVAVIFKENGAPTNNGNDLHLIRLDDGTTVAEVNAWMDFQDVGPDGFYNTDTFGPALTSTHDAPGPQTWLGGVQDIQPPLPETAYFHVQLKPGEYAWVAELPDPKSRGFLKTFTVPSR